MCPLSEVEEDVITDHSLLLGDAADLRVTVELRDLGASVNLSLALGSSRQSDFLRCLLARTASLCAGGRRSGNRGIRVDVHIIFLVQFNLSSRTNRHFSLLKRLALLRGLITCAPAFRLLLNLDVFVDLLLRFNFSMLLSVILLADPLGTSQNGFGLVLGDSLALGWWWLLDDFLYLGAQCASSLNESIKVDSTDYLSRSGFAWIFLDFIGDFLHFIGSFLLLNSLRLLNAVRCSLLVSTNWFFEAIIAVAFSDVQAIDFHFDALFTIAWLLRVGVQTMNAKDTTWSTQSKLLILDSSLLLRHLDQWFLLGYRLLFRTLLVGNDAVK